MITIIPHDASIECAGGFGVCPTREGDWWAIYQWFCEQFIHWKGRDNCYDVLNGRSKCGCLESHRIQLDNRRVGTIRRCLRVDAERIRNRDNKRMPRAAGEGERCEQDEKREPMVERIVESVGRLHARLACM